VKFFDRDCLFPSGFARLAKETGCAMIPCEKYYLPDWVHQKLVFKEPFYSSGDITLDVQNCVSHLERMIRLHPSQWWMWDNAAMLWESLNKTCGNPAQSL
jgi:lauroyl/myristoyl acyltransferase